MQLEILTPDQKVFGGEVDELFVPGAKGAFEVLKNHAPIISALSPGTVKVCTVGQPDRSFSISRGVVEVRENQIYILVESIIS